MCHHRQKFSVDIKKCLFLLIGASLAGRKIVDHENVSTKGVNGAFLRASSQHCASSKGVLCVEKKINVLWSQWEKPGGVTPKKPTIPQHQENKHTIQYKFSLLLSLSLLYYAPWSTFNGGGLLILFVTI